MQNFIEQIADKISVKQIGVWLTNDYSRNKTNEF
jgi:hypothetical protein